MHNLQNDVKNDIKNGFKKGVIYPQVRRVIYPQVGRVIYRPEELIYPPEEVHISTRGGLYIHQEKDINISSQLWIKKELSGSFDHSLQFNLQFSISLLNPNQT